MYLFRSINMSVVLRGERKRERELEREYLLSWKREWERKNYV